MYQSFSSCQANKKSKQVAATLDVVCEAIVRSGTPFKRFWQTVGMPELLKGNYRNECELLENWANGLLEMHGFTMLSESCLIIESGIDPITGQPMPTGADPSQFAGMQGGPRPQQQGWMSKLGNWFGNMFGGKKGAQNPAAPEAPAAPQPQPLSADAMAKIQASKDLIKTDLGNTLGTLETKMKQNRDTMGLQVTRGLMTAIPKFIDSVGFKRGEGKFDKEKEFGPAPATQNVSSRFAEILKNPETRQKMVAQYAQKLGVQPGHINRLIDSGFTDPRQWPAILQKQKEVQAGGGLNFNAGGATMGAPQPAVPAGAPTMRKFMAKEHNLFIESLVRGAGKRLHASNPMSM